MAELPQRLKDAQEEINAFRKEDALKKLVGKYYSVHHGMGYPDGLRRIYLDKNNKIRVDHYSHPKGSMDFEFKTFTITEAEVDHLQHEFDEIEDPALWYNLLKSLLNIPQIRRVFIKDLLEK